MKCMLVMDDWRKSGVAGSVYNTQLGLSLSTGDIHGGSTFNATVELPPEITAEILDAWIAHRAYPVFCLIPGEKP